MDPASEATRSSLRPPSVLAASRPSLQTDAVVTATAAAVLLLLLTFVVWPVLRVLATSLEGPAGLTPAHYAEFFSSWRLFRILVQSLAVSAVSTVLTVAAALVLAYSVTRTDIPGKRFISLMSLLPLISPPFLVSLAFILLFGRNGLITRALGLEWSIYGFAGIVVSQVFTFLPQAYILLANVLGNIDASPASFTWTIDTTAPDTSLTSTPPASSNSSSATFTFSSPDGTATFECPAAPCVPSAQ
ncbi:MAG: hypothetical protein AAB387_11370, partial [candidate division NC10 bacterium]